MEFFRSMCDVRRRAARNDGRFEPGFARERNAKAVAGMERFEELAFRPDVDAAVRQHAIDIEDDEPDALGALARRALSCTLCK